MPDLKKNTVLGVPQHLLQVCSDLGTGATPPQLQTPSLHHAQHTSSQKNNNDKTRTIFLRKWLARWPLTPQHCRWVALDIRIDADCELEEGLTGFSLRKKKVWYQDSPWSRWQTRPFARCPVLGKPQTLDFGWDICLRHFRFRQMQAVVSYELWLFRWTSLNQASNQGIFLGCLKTL